VYQLCADRLAAIVDRTGVVHAALVWREGSEQLRSLAVDGAVVDGAVIEHPLLGAAHAVGATAMSALAWARPSEIPTIAEPGRLPPGAGGAILNVIAVLAERAGVAHLRYAGPYPTSALWRALARSYRCTADEAELTAGALDRALRVARDPIAIEFSPAPHERIAIPGGFVELRARVERVVVDAVSYEPGGSPARLIDGGGEHHCELWFGDAPYARIASVARDGTLRDGPRAVPACPSPVIGRAFPPALRAALAELVAGAVAAPLADAARAVCARRAIRWADLGARVARDEPDGFAVHAVLWERIAPLGLSRLALALAEALAPEVAAHVLRAASPRMAT
jgi:hypothetical protein